MSPDDSQRCKKCSAFAAHPFREREGKKGISARIGSAWQHADNSGFNLQLDCVPLDGRITVRVPSERDEQ